ncbi:hypothetical protein C8R47DRAFT_812586 [Mycena vitilis]|nr:hypothetical protein C8R47DRAFT_812586 [Mycena vitilis]
MVDGLPARLVHPHLQARERGAVPEHGVDVPRRGREGHCGHAVQPHGGQRFGDGRRWLELHALQLSRDIPDTGPPPLRPRGDDIVNSDNRVEVQTCELVNLADLGTDTDYVRRILAAYGNHRLSLGLDLVRRHAARCGEAHARDRHRQHPWPAHLEAVHQPGSHLGLGRADPAVGVCREWGSARIQIHDGAEECVFRGVPLRYTRVRLGLGAAAAGRARVGARARWRLVLRRRRRRRLERTSPSSGASPSLGRGTLRRRSHYRRRPTPPGRSR